MKTLDVIVIGGGSAGLSAARFAASQGARVGLVESGRPGGYGLFKSRLPRQVLDGWGASPDSGGILERLIEAVKQQGEAISRELIEELADTGVEWIPGTGSLASGRQVRVQHGGETATLQADSVVIATGSVSRPVPTLPFDEESILPIDRLWDWKVLPESLLVVHADLPGLEAAQEFSRLGTKVFLVDAGERLIHQQDPELIAALETGFKKQKIKILSGKHIVSIYKDSHKVDVTLDGGIKLSVERILVSGERLGNTEPLGLEALNIETGENREVWVNEHMETSLKSVFAAGSVTGRPHSTASSEEEGRIAGLNAAGQRLVLDKDQIPFVLHTRPGIASIGCLGSEAHYKGYRAMEGRCEGSEDGGPDSAPSAALCKVVADRESRKIIGAQMFGADVAPCVSLVQSKMREGVSLKELTQVKGNLSLNIECLIKAARDCLKKFSVRR